MSDWIRCEDRLPELHEEQSCSEIKCSDVVLVMASCGCELAELWSDGYWSDKERSISFDDVTHWQPLPEPPK